MTKIFERLFIQKVQDEMFEIQSIVIFGHQKLKKVDKFTVITICFLF